MMGDYFPDMGHFPEIDVETQLRAARTENAHLHAKITAADMFIENLLNALITQGAKIWTLEQDLAESRNPHQIPAGNPREFLRVINGGLS